MSLHSSILSIFERFGGKLLYLILGFGLGAASMALAPCDSSTIDTTADQGNEDASLQTVWICSMHPQIQQDGPGQCPLCAMDLISLTEGTQNDQAQGDMVVLSKRAQALARLRTTPVRRESDTPGELKLLGRFEADETTLKTVTAWTGGRIDRLRANTTGEKVRAGQVIATLYSPEVFTAHQDLIVAKRHHARTRTSPESSRLAALAALEAARERLRLLGVPQKELSRMESRSQPTRSVSIRSPFSGTVLERLATEGSYVKTGTALHRIADLRTLWLQLDAYESDLSRLSVGQAVQILVDALPGEEFTGKITFIEPIVDLRRRTAQVRVQVKNREGTLAPGMFAQAIVKTGASTDSKGSLVIPASAPLFTGRRAVVYVEVNRHGQRGYESRIVRLGPKLGTVYPVVSGLHEGERVVTQGAFALDADLQIKGGPSMMSDSRQEGPSGEPEIVKLDAGQRAKLAPLLEQYLAVQVALAADQLAQANLAARELARIASKNELTFKASKHQALWTPLSSTLLELAKTIGESSSLEQARGDFEQLSTSISKILIHYGNPLDKPLRLAYCPMAAGSRGAQWIQTTTEIDNSYFGASMRQCGEFRSVLSPGTFLAPNQANIIPPNGNEEQR